MKNKTFFKLNAIIIFYWGFFGYFILFSENSSSSLASLYILEKRNIYLLSDSLVLISLLCSCVFYIPVLFLLYSIKEKQFTIHDLSKLNYFYVVFFLIINLYCFKYAVELWQNGIWGLSLVKENVQNDQYKKWILFLSLECAFILFLFPRSNKKQKLIFWLMIFNAVTLLFFMCFIFGRRNDLFKLFIIIIYYFMARNKLDIFKSAILLVVVTVVLTIIAFGKRGTLKNDIDFNSSFLLEALLSKLFSTETLASLTSVYQSLSLNKSLLTSGANFPFTSTYDLLSKYSNTGYDQGLTISPVASGFVIAGFFGVIVASSIWCLYLYSVKIIIESLKHKIVQNAVPLILSLQTAATVDVIRGGIENLYGSLIYYFILPLIMTLNVKFCKGR